MEGPLNNLQPSMIQFSKPKRSLSKAMDQFRRHETSARDYMSGASDDRALVPLYASSVLTLMPPFLSPQIGHS